MTSGFDKAKTIVATLRADAGVSDMVAQVHLLRYSADPAKFDELLYAVLGVAMCIGARRAIAEIQQEVAK